MASFRAGLNGKKLSNKHPNQRQEGARFALLVFAFINLLNYCDRYVPSAVKPLFQEELQLSASETSWPTSAMVVVYMICAPIFGFIADHDLVDRRLILAFAVVFWSLATGLAGLAHDLGTLIALRSLVGVGEAAYTTIVPPMIADFYPPHERNAAFTIFGLTMPFGGAIGYAIGAVLGEAAGWRAAFFACGAPGLLAALLIMFINDPFRGINDADATAEQELQVDPGMESDDAANDEEEHAIGHARRAEKPRTTGPMHDLLEILSNKHWVLAVAGQIANSFAIGGFADWYETYLNRYYGMGLGTAGLIVGAGTLIGGIVGTLLGAKVVQWSAACLGESRAGYAYYLVPALFTLPGTALAILAVNAPFSLPYLASAAVILGEICFFTYIAPMNALCISVISTRLRAKSSGLLILLVHVLGDVVSPPIIGAISDHSGSLQQSMQLCWIAVAASGFFWLTGYLCLSPPPGLSASSPPGSGHGHGHGNGGAGGHSAEGRNAGICSLLRAPPSSDSECSSTADTSSSAADASSATCSELSPTGDADEHSEAGAAAPKVPQL